MFSKLQEEALNARLQKLSKIGFGLTRDELRSSVFQYAESLQKKHPFSKNEKAAGHRWVNFFFFEKKQEHINSPK